jgi:uncharacterized membrane protein YozB (DUF420 family)
MRAKYATAFLLSLLADVVATWNGYAVAHRHIITVAVLGFVLPFVNLLLVVYFIDEKTTWGRLKLTFTVALASSIGSSMTILTVTRLGLTGW